MLARWRKRLIGRRTTARPAPVLESVQAYARWAATYPPHAHNPLMQAEEAVMRALMPPLEGSTILDLAGGTGRYGLIAQTLGAATIIELDNSPHMLKANALPLRAISTMEAIPLTSASIDGVICALAIGHVRNIRPAFREIARILKPGGWALISDVHPLIALTGGQRTFQAGGDTFAVEHHVHLYADIHLAAAETGLTINAVREATLSDGPNPRLPVVIVWQLGKTFAR